MSRYWILEAVAYMDNGEPLFYRTIPKEPVEIDDEVAASLGNKVRPVESPDESETGTHLDGIVRTVEDLPEVEEPAPKPKRKRKAEEEEPDGDPEL
jgi:hypothetical protein